MSSDYLSQRTAFLSPPAAYERDLGQSANFVMGVLANKGAGGTGYKGDSSGSLTQGAYSFCCPVGSDGTQYDGDGVTPIESALAMKEYVPHADTMVLDDVGHFCWSDVFGGETVAPELTKEHREGRPWYGDEAVIEKWAGWL